MRFKSVNLPNARTLESDPVNVKSQADRIGGLLYGYAQALRCSETRFYTRKIFKREEGWSGPTFGQGMAFSGARAATRACHKARVDLQYSHGK